MAQSANLVWFKPCSSVGTAVWGTDPGSVKVVLAWEARAKAHRVEYTVATIGRSELFCARSVTVNPEYTMSIHTMPLITIPL